MDLNQKDPNVMTFMMQMVQEKHGDSVDSKFLEEEATKLYDEFGDRLVSYFEPMLSDEQKGQFDELVSQGSDQDKLLEFLIGSIDNLEQRILDTLNQFKTEYMSRPTS
ncbi:MAG: hypothetical protein PHS44_04965 [Candidatus Dojkabacteria bacterium]|nr:hypothetical protein [Candidatus Dojkabacteria bacterium]